MAHAILVSRYPTASLIVALSLHDALPICAHRRVQRRPGRGADRHRAPRTACAAFRSEEHTSELQSLTKLVCRLLLQKKKAKVRPRNSTSHRTSETDPHRSSPISTRASASA